MESAHLTGEGIEVRGLSISEPDAPGPQGELVFIEELFFACRTSLQELVSGEPAVSAIRVRRPVLRITRRPDDTFSLSQLLAHLPPARKVLPTTIENGVVIVFDPIKNPSCTCTLREVNLTIDASRAENAQPSWLDVEGTLMADHVGRAEITGTVDPAGGRWKVGGTIDSLAMSPELRAGLPEHASKWLEPLDCAAGPSESELSSGARRTGRVRLNFASTAN